MSEMNLTIEEKNLANQLKRKFGEVRSNISSIDQEMELLTYKAGTLVKELEKLREEERIFLESLEKKYGEGSLDPFKLVYKK